MRRCDICSTPIPPGENRCPNCGYIYRPETKTIEEKKASEERKRKYMSQFEFHPMPKTNRPRKTVLNGRVMGRRRTGVIIGVITVLIVVFIGLGVVFNLVADGGLPSLFGDTEHFDDILWDDDDVIEYEDMASLEADYPDVAEEIRPYYDQVVTIGEPNYSVDYLYESYEVEDQAFSSAYMSSSFTINDELYFDYTVYNFGFGGWTKDLQLNKYVEENPVSFTLNDFAQVAEILSLDQEDLYDFCQEMFETKIADIHSLDDQSSYATAQYNRYTVSLYVEVSEESDDVSHYASFSFTQDMD